MEEVVCLSNFYQAIVENKDKQVQPNVMWHILEHSSELRSTTGRYHNVWQLDRFQGLKTLLYRGHYTCNALSQTNISLKPYSFTQISTLPLYFSFPKPWKIVIFPKFKSLGPFPKVEVYALGSGKASTGYTSNVHVKSHVWQIGKALTDQRRS